MTDWLRDLWDFGDLEGTEHRLRARLDAETTDGARSEVLTQLARVEGLRSDGDPPVQKTPSPLRLTTGYCRNQSKGECSMSVKHVWVVLALVVAACGGGDDVGVQVDPPVAENAAGTQTTEGESTTQSTAAAAPTATTVAGAASSGGESIARVTIGDRQYEFALEGRFTQCRLFAGAALFGSGYTVDGDGTLQSTNDAGASVTFHLPVADWEAKGLDEPSIKVSDNSDDTDWLAGEVDGLNIDPELSKIDIWTLDGATATGTALFVELGQALGGTGESVPGTFEVSCATP